MSNNRTTFEEIDSRFFLENEAYERKKRDMGFENVLEIKEKAKRAKCREKYYGPEGHFDSCDKLSNNSLIKELQNTGFFLFKTNFDFKKKCETTVYEHYQR